MVNCCIISTQDESAIPKCVHMSSSQVVAAHTGAQTKHLLVGRAISYLISQIKEFILPPNTSLVCLQHLYRSGQCAPPPATIFSRMGKSNRKNQVLRDTGDPDQSDNLVSELNLSSTQDLRLLVSL